MEVTPLSPETRRYLQQYLLREHVGNNPGWRPNHSGRYVGCYEGLELIVWRATDKLPTIVDRLRVVRPIASFARGLGVVLASSALERETIVGAVPIELYPRCFLWLPSFSEVRYSPTSICDPETTWRMTMILALQAAGPRPRAGELSVSTLKEFRNLWPELV